MANTNSGDKSIKNEKFTLSDFEIAGSLGQGALGHVVKARLKNSNIIMALKMVNKKDLTTPDEMNFLKREIEIHSHLRNDNIIRMYNYFYDAEKICMMLEYCRFGSLDKIITKERHFNNCISASYIYQLCNSLKYLHSIKVIHRDIKPENALIGRKGQLKLGDFGCSVHNKAIQRYTRTGTLDYLSPEIIERSPHNDKVDMWGVGVFLFEMLTGLPPFYADGQNETARKIVNLRYRIPNEIDSTANFLITNLLRLSPSMRLTAEQVLSSDFIQNFAEKSFSECSAILPILSKHHRSSKSTRNSSESGAACSDITNSTRDN